MSTPVIRVRDVSWTASDGQRIVDDISMDVGPGECVAILGRNGAGKSTLLDIIAGLRAPTRGVIELAGRPLAAWPPRERARRLAHMPQALRPDVPIDGAALVAMGRYPYAARWHDTTEDLRIARDAMARCGCDAFAHRSVATLSAGERQRVYLAACLAQQAPVLLLDEPATFLDIDQQTQCFRLLRDEADRGVACLTVTHDLNLALACCTRLVVLDRGRIAHDLSAAHACDDPRWLDVFSPRLQLRRDEMCAHVVYR